MVIPINSENGSSMTSKTATLTWLVSK